MPRMRHALLFAVAFAVGCAPGDDGEEASASPETAAPDQAPTVVLETNRGRIVLQLDREKAPNTVTSFLRHVGAGFYDGVIFHRVRADFMIQAGVLTADRQRRTSASVPVSNEAANGLLNVRGAVAMARSTDPHSAKSQFFINLKDNPELDFREQSPEGWGYAVFGRVTEGMDVVEDIGAVRTERWRTHEAVPIEPIVIERAYVPDDEAN